uniref:Uncharacterized protein n=1 Tax=Leersia perrieri TaxID=77586 RepID=A0A0D9WSC3_9ORYZ
MRGGGGGEVDLVSGGGGVAAAGKHEMGMWMTPTPYLFLGFALMMGLIAVALLVLVCTRRKHHHGGAGDEESSAAAVKVMVPLDREPKVVVIMAGDTAPSFLASAKPLFASFLPTPPPPPPAAAAAEVMFPFIFRYELEFSYICNRPTARGRKEAAEQILPHIGLSLPLTPWRTGVGLLGFQKWYMSLNTIRKRFCPIIRRYDNFYFTLSVIWVWGYHVAVI